jgi:hypothetical protein
VTESKLESMNASRWLGRVGRHGRIWIAVPLVIVLSILVAVPYAASSLKVTSPTDRGSAITPQIVSPGSGPVSNCFGGAPCTGPSGTSAGSGTTCVISSFFETPGRYMYVAINYLAGSNQITSVSDGGLDGFNFIGGEFANDQSVAFYDAPSEHGGFANIIVTASSVVFGTCRVGELNLGSMAGAIGTATTWGTSLSLSVSATHPPSLLLALIGSSRPSGAYTMSAPAGNWLTGGQQATGYNPGTESALYGYNDTTGGTVTFSFSTGAPVSISGIVVEFYPQAPPASNCFGGGTCTGPSGTSAGSGTTCVISSFSETAGDFLYVAINYLAGSNVISSVSDQGVDTFHFVGGEFANLQSVAFYDVPSEHGGTVTITVSLSIAEFGSCRAGQLNSGMTVGVVGAGASVNSGTGLTLSNGASHAPSLLLAMIGSTRPSGAYTMSAPAGNWLTGGQQATGYNPGTESALYGYNDTTGGTVTFSFSTGAPVSISGIVVEFYASAPLMHIWGSFKVSGPFPTWGYLCNPILGCSYPCGNPTLGHQSTIWLEDDVSTWQQRGAFSSQIWENQSSGNSGFNYNYGCGISYNGGSVTWGGVLSCGAFQEQTFSWDPSFTETWYNPLFGDPSSQVTFNIQVQTCAGGTISVYMTLNGTLIMDWVGIAYELVTLPL